MLAVGSPNGVITKGPEGLCSRLMGNKNGRRRDQPGITLIIVDFGLFRYCFAAPLLSLPGDYVQLQL